MKFVHYLITSLIVFFLPLLLLVVDWSFADLGNYEYLYIFTQSSDGIFAIITSIILLGIILYFYRSNWRLCLAIAIYCTFAVAGTQAIKYVLKNTFAESRPYIAEMSKRMDALEAQNNVFEFMQTAYNVKHNVEFDIDNVEGPFLAGKEAKTPADYQDHFYSLTPEEREFYVTYVAESLFPENPDQRDALVRLAPDNNYSLPSGHSIFASTWMFIFGITALASRKKSFLAVAGLVFVWGFGVEASRVFLGYHYGHDVLFSSIIANIFVWSTFMLMFFLYRIILKIAPPAPGRA